MVSKHGGEGGGVMEGMVVLLGGTFKYAAPLWLAALGGLLAARAGVRNLGLEGTMALGALVAAWTVRTGGSPWLALWAGGCIGLLPGLLLALAVVTCRGDWKPAGLGVNILGQALVSLLFLRLFGQGVEAVSIASKLPRPFRTLWPALAMDASFPLALLLAALLWMLLWHTRFGLRIRATGEHAHAAETAGLSVHRIRYGCLAASGLLAGLGGACLALSLAAYTAQAVSGQGYMAFAAVLIGRRTVKGTLCACLLCGAAFALLNSLGWWGLSLPPLALSLLPYFLSLALLLTAKRAAPGISSSNEGA